MKKFILYFPVFFILLAFVSCEKDAGKLPIIAFITGSGYISSDVSLTKGSTIVIGIKASKAEDKDVLKKFNLSKSVNGAAAVTMVDKTLSGTEADSFTFEQTEKLDTVVGVTNKYTFTVTNRDGLVNQVSLSVTTK